MNADSPTDFTNATPRDFLRRLVAAEELSAPAMKALMEQIMNGSWTPPQIAAFMVAMSAKGETSEELVSAACVMREHSLGKPGKPQPVLDIVGSGGDGLQTPNISQRSCLNSSQLWCRCGKAWQSGGEQPMWQCRCAGSPRAATRPPTSCCPSLFRSHRIHLFVCPNIPPRHETRCPSPQRNRTAQHL